MVEVGAEKKMMVWDSEKRSERLDYMRNVL